MFSTEIRVNGEMIGHLYGQNIGYTNPNKHNYFYRYYDVTTGITTEGYVTHERDKGIKVLLAKIMEDMTNG